MFATIDHHVLNYEPGNEYRRDMILRTLTPRYEHTHARQPNTHFRLSIYVNCRCVPLLFILAGEHLSCIDVPSLGMLFF